MAVIFPIKSTFDAKGVNAAKKSFNGLSTTSRNLAKNVLLPTVALGAVAFKFVKAGENAATANARILQINTSMGLFGSQTKEVTDRLVKLAEKTALNTGVDQNAIKLTQAKLLTFKELAKTADSVGGSFDRATAAAVDMASAGFGDATSNAVQLGKALNDPIKGITALTRSGITFTAQEKEKIKTLVQSGKTLQAQEMILAAIEKQVGGTARATANSSDKIKVAFSLVSEQIGMALLPAFDKMTDVILTKIIPVVQVFINALTGNQSLSKGFSDAERKAFEFGNIVRAVVQTIVNYIPFLMKFGAALVGMFVVAKVAAAAGAIIKIIGGLVTAFQTLRKVGLAATIATAFATGGLSVAAGAAGAVAALGAIAVGFAALDKVTDKYKENVQGLPTINIAPDGVLKDAEKFKDVVLPAVDEVGKSSDKTTKAVKKTAKAVKGLSEEGKIAKKQIAAFGSQLEIENQKLASTVAKFDSFKSSVSEAISRVLSFGSAQEESSETQRAAVDAQIALTDAQKEYDKALKTDNIEAQQSALENLQAAQTAATDSITKKKSFIQVLQDQANLAATFGDKVKTLISMGLSETAIGQVLAAGADAGSKIADEIIAGGATVVDQVNTLVTATESVADAVGEASAAQFYQAGITAGQSLVDGVKAAIAAAGFSITADGTIINKAAIDQVNKAVRKARNKKSEGGTKITKKERQSIEELATSLGVDIPKMAKGGIVTGPTLALIGEAGPEAVIPLSGRNAGMGTTINLTVNAGMGADGAAIGREIVDAIKRYERTSGPVFASA
jgi:hypothetical protein